MPKESSHIVSRWAPILLHIIVFTLILLIMVGCEKEEEYYIDRPWLTSLSVPDTTYITEEIYRIDAFVSWDYRSGSSCSDLDRIEISYSGDTVVLDAQVKYYNHDYCTCDCAGWVGTIGITPPYSSEKIYVKAIGREDSIIDSTLLIEE